MMLEQLEFGLRGSTDLYSHRFFSINNTEEKKYWGEIVNKYECLFNVIFSYLMSTVGNAYNISCIVYDNMDVDTDRQFILKTKDINL